MRLEGLIVDSETFSNVSGVHIFNQQRLGTVSNEKGFFSMPVHVGDTISFSRIDYELETIIINEGENYKELLITMKQKVYILDSVNVFSGIPEPTHLFKKENKPVYIPGVTKNVEKGEDDYKTSFGEAVFSPATAIYNAFSKKYKEEKKYNEIKKNESLEESRKRAAFKALEEYLDTQDLDISVDHYEELIDYCNVRTVWLANANSYDIYMRMHTCIEEYVSSHLKK